MNLLLDTCSFLWASNQPEKLTTLSLGLISAPENSIFLSSACVWELCVKNRMGKLDLPRPPREFVQWAIHELRLLPLPLSLEAAALEAGLPVHHRDPFDRMLVCQALHHGLTILTPDRLIRRYGISCVW